MHGFREGSVFVGALGGHRKFEFGREEVHAKVSLGRCARLFSRATSYSGQLWGVFLPLVTGRTYNFLRESTLRGAFGQCAKVEFTRRKAPAVCKAADVVGALRTHSPLCHTLAHFFGQNIELVHRGT